ncbi:MAG: SMC-Scp complex subunit ScpB [Pirellulaceae bacterium]|nr:SMC-Scp complex subunit ScpB [Pirellulaceae bacterium]
MVDQENQSGPNEDAADGIEVDDGSGEGDADEVISLDALTAAYAGLVGGGEVARSNNPAVAADSSQSPKEQDEADEPKPGEAEADEHVSPLGILEAVLFVGNAENTPLTAKRIAALMRGVSPREIDELVIDLNDRYRELECPYEVVSQGAGYLLNIRDEYANLRDRFYGSVREARLSQAAVDILAVIAYGQPLTREEIDETRGRPSGGILSQLVRRQLLRIERPDKKPRRPKYHTTERFLKIMGLEDISELPESQEFDRRF